MADQQEIKLEIIKRETIKPSHETPKHLRNHLLSLFDQINWYRHTACVFFYTNSPKSASERTQRLKETLPKVLSLFYPLAGRLRDNNFSIECSDEGAEFVEAKSSSTISEILRRPDLEVLHKFLPGETDEFIVGVDQYLLRVQSTAFGCGGTALGVCVTHKIADFASLKSFLKAWAEIARGEPVSSNPEFRNGSALLPPVSGFFSPPETHDAAGEYVVRRYVFEGTKIEALKNKSTNPNFKPSRVEAVSALLLRVMIRTSHLLSQENNYNGKFVWGQVVNLRNLVGSKLRDNDIGSLCLGYNTVNDGDLIDHVTLVRNMRKEIEHFKQELMKSDNFVELARKSFEELVRLATVGQFYMCSSLCRLGLYDIDFGWEKPIWVSRVGNARKNLVMLINSNDGHGIEAWVSMREKDVALVEADEELLDFASLNPSVHCYKQNVLCRL